MGQSLTKAAFPVLLMLALVSGTARAGDEKYDKFRLAMVEGQIKARGVKDPAVLKAMGEVPRHVFVDPGQRSRAYEDHPLPIGYGQTISQPYIVAYMTEILGLKGGERILEVGTGSGYQAAILARIAARVFSVEIVEPLFLQARARLKDLGYNNISLKCGDGYFGWPEMGPFDAVVVTCAAGHLPPPLIRHLKPGGRIIIPVGRPMAVQDLVLVKKDDQGRVRTRSLMAVRFVPLVRGGN